MVKKIERLGYKIHSCTVFLTSSFILSEELLSRDCAQYLIEAVTCEGTGKILMDKEDS